MDEKYKKLIQRESGNEDENENKKLASELYKFFIEIIKVVIISAIIVIPVRHYVIQPFFVSGASMQPQFFNGEYLIIDEITYRSNPPQRGDVIVFRYPKKTTEFYIKRVIGLPGETVEIKDGNVIIFNKDNPWGMILSEPYLAEGEVTRGNVYTKLENNNYFVMGDNRQASSDSRSWGAVDDKYIIGKVWLRAWPIDRAKIFKEEITY